MYLEPNELATVRDILAFYAKNLEVRAFGSRVTGERLKKFSDLDLVLMTQEPLPMRDYARIKDAFTLSDLPYRVDVLDWANVSPEFKKIIQANYEIVQEPNPQSGRKSSEPIGSK